MKLRLCALFSAIFFGQISFAADCSINSTEIDDRCSDPGGSFLVPLITGDVIFSGSPPGEPGGEGDREGGADCRMECPEDGAPPNPTLECAQNGRQLACVVWPQGAGLTYIWSHTPGLTLHQPLVSQSPTQLIDCGNYVGEAVVHLSAQSRGGLRSHGERIVSCSATGLLIGTVEDPNLPTLPTPTPPDPQM